MTFQDFLKTATNPDFWKTKRVFVFQSGVCPFLFFNFLWQRLIETNVITLPKKNITVETNFDNVRQILEQGLLGMSNFYWLGDISGYAKKDNLIAFLSKYQGPHWLAFFISNDTNVPADALSNIQVIHICTSLPFADFKLLAQIFCTKIAQQKLSAIRKIFDSEQKELQIDTCCQILSYLDFINSTSTDELNEYLYRIIGTQPEINKLVTYFFTKQARPFFTLWADVESKYSEIFWTVFWSDKIWRAFHVVKYMIEKDFIKTKQMSYGLPFVFVNDSWKSFELSYLHKLYQDLYKIENSIKRGSTFHSLDLFYLAHFQSAL